VSGLSAILNIIALLGFVIFIAGAALAVLSASQGRPARGGVLLAVVGLVAGVLFSVIGQGVIIVEPTQVAVVVNSLSGEVEEPKSGGLHIVVPVVQRVAVYYPITQQEYTMSATAAEGARGSDDAVVARTNDGQTITIDITILFRIPAETVGELYLNWNENYADGFVRPTTRSIAREIVSAYSAEQIYGDARSQLGNDIQAALAERFATENLELTDLLVRDITFSPEFTDAIEQKVVAEQNLERARTEAQRVEAEAAGRARAQVAEAQGDAESRTIRAGAEASALQLVSEQIAANPGLIQYLYVQNLSDNVRLVLLPSSSPFLFDFESLSAANPDLVAPEVPQVTPDATETPAAP
jgi:prohibitin 2